MASVPIFIQDRKQWLVPLFVWTLLVGISLVDHLNDLRSQSLTVATEGARNMFRMILLTRQWNAEHGGVYVPVTEKLEPNQYLEHPKRDLTTVDGMKLTMVNPAFMTRLLGEMSVRQSGTTFHITSLRPIRPANAPDAWERTALETFTEGAREMVEIVKPAQVDTGETSLLRYMAPLFIQQACLKCHEKQGYKLDDIRGGISISQPFEPVMRATVPAIRQSIVTHIGTYVLIGFAGWLVLTLLRRRWLALDDTIAQLTAARHDLEQTNTALEAARAEADAANLAKSAFLANMSHEIRTPMNAIIGMSDLALRNEIDRQQRNYLQKIQGAGRHLLGVINDILDFSKIEAGKFVLNSQEFDLEQLLDSVSAQLGERVAAKGLELYFNLAPDTPRKLIGDEQRLRQILLNLGGNAVKFTDAGEIAISVTWSDLVEDEATLAFSVRDTGIGMSNDQQGRLFSSFEQADNSITRRYGGTGLGLAISKRMVELMGGTISAESSPGNGSCFAFSIRFRLGTQEPGRLLPSPDLRGRRILAVDDNAHVREMMGNMLRSMSFEVSVAASGSEAVAALQSAVAHGKPFELAILDREMPEMDGICTAQEIKRQMGEQRPAFLLVTLCGNEDFTEQAKAAEIVEIVPKPVTPSLLFDAILSVFRARDGVRTTALRCQSSAPLTLVSIQGARVLLVDDNELNREVASDLLGIFGLRVDCAENGALALSMLNANDYDLVFMDMQMPVMDGLTATAEIRRQPRFANLPVIAMTANAMDSDREACLRAGMNEHLAKPIDPDRLQEVLVRWIKRGKPSLVQPTLSLDRALEHHEQQAIACLRGIESLDLAAGLHLARDRGRLYLSLLHKYVSSQQDFMGSLDAALDAGDRVTAIRLAHTLRGLSGQIGAKNIQAIAAVLENSLKLRENAEVSLILKNQIAEMLESLITRIKHCLPEESVPSATMVVNREDLRELGEQLLALMTNCDFAAVRMFEANHAQLRSGLGEELADIKAALDDFDFDSASRQLVETLIRNGLHNP